MPRRPRPNKSATPKELNKKYGNETNPYFTKDFLNERDKWYKYLRDTGFNEIEGSSPEKSCYFDTPYLKDNSTKNKKTTLKSMRTLSAEYYRRCEYYLHHGQFDSVKQKQVWSLYCQGIPKTEISKRLKISKPSIHINLVEKRMKESDLWKELDTDEIEDTAEKDYYILDTSELNYHLFPYLDRPLDDEE
jgi:hypothetical protein